MERNKSIPILSNPNLTKYHHHNNSVEKFSAARLPVRHPHRGAQRANRQPQPGAGSASRGGRPAEQLGEEKQASVASGLDSISENLIIHIS